MNEVFDIWAKRYPRPTDRLVYSIYKDYQKLLKNSITTFTTRVMTDRVPDLDVQLDSSRLKIVKDKLGRVTPILSFRPTFDDATQLKIEFYHRFFEVYNSLYVNLSTEVLRSVYNRKEKIKTPGVKAQKYRMHFYVVLMNILIIAMKQNRLSKQHLDLIARSDTKLTERYNDMIREMGLDTSLSYSFAMDEPGASFFDKPNSALVGAWFKYQRKLQAAYNEEVEVEDTVDGGYDQLWLVQDCKVK